LKYGQPYTEIDTEEEKEEKASKHLWNDEWYASPNRRIKKSEASFFPFPDLFMQNVNRARNNPVTKRKVEEMTIPWDMKYFSPMLRG
jgi:hypothetical protein